MTWLPRARQDTRELLGSFAPSQKFPFAFECVKMKTLHPNTMIPKSARKEKHNPAPEELFFHRGKNSVVDSDSPVFCRVFVSTTNPEVFFSRGQQSFQSFSFGGGCICAFSFWSESAL